LTKRPVGRFLGEPPCSRTSTRWQAALARRGECGGRDRSLGNRRKATAFISRAVAKAGLTLSSLRFSPNGNWLAAQNPDGVQLWNQAALTDPSNGEGVRVGQKDMGMATIKDFAFDAKDRFILTSDNYGLLILWPLETMKPEVRPSPLRIFDARPFFDANPFNFPNPELLALDSRTTTLSSPHRATAPFGAGVSRRITRPSNLCSGTGSGVDYPRKNGTNISAGNIPNSMDPWQSRFFSPGDRAVANAS